MTKRKAFKTQYKHTRIHKSETECHTAPPPSVCHLSDSRTNSATQHFLQPKVSDILTLVLFVLFLPLVSKVPENQENHMTWKTRHPWFCPDWGHVSSSFPPPTPTAPAWVMTSSAHKDLVPIMPAVFSICINFHTDIKFYLQIKPSLIVIKSIQFSHILVKVLTRSILKSPIY